MHLLALTSRCLYCIHPLLQVPPEWEGLGAKLMVGGLFLLSPSTRLHLHSHFPCPSFLIPGIKVMKTGVSFEFKHYFTKYVCKVGLVTESNLYRAEAFSP